jgi:hypothetical protein
MTITVPDEMREELERNAKAAGFATVEDYLIWLCKSDGNGTGDLKAEDLGYASEEALEAKLIASLDSGPPVDATRGFWDEMSPRRKT